jgi:threonine dehydratase
MKPVAELTPTLSAVEVVTNVHGILERRFDLDAYDKYLASVLDGTTEADDPFAMSAFEQPLDFDGFPADFEPHFYQRSVDDTQGGIRHTRTEYLGDFDGRPVYDKREDLHPYVRAFKARGALFDVLATVSEHPAVRVFTANSTGNHARGVVAAVNLLNTALIESGAVRVNEYGEVLREDAHLLFRARIFTDKNIESEKKQALLDGGAEVLDRFGTLGEAGKAAQNEAKAQPNETAYIHPYDTDSVIAGQATLGMELLIDLARQGVDLRNTPVTLRVAVGGGGLYAGQQAMFAHAIVRGLLHPDSRVVAVEATNNDSTNRELKGQPPLAPATLSKVAGGIATLTSGRRGVATIRTFSPGGVRVVDESYMLRAAEALARAHDGVPPEFAGSLSLASLLKDIDERNINGNGIEVTITCGGNASPALLHTMLEKGSVHEDERVVDAATYLGPAVFRIISRNALEPAPLHAVTSPVPTERRFRAPLNVISRPFVAA